MAQVFSNEGEESDPKLVDAGHEEPWAAARQAVYKRQRSVSAQEAAAARLDKSAESHDRIATMYEEIAERTSSPDECQNNASRHRAFAREDRRRAAQLRQVAERQAVFDPTGKFASAQTNAEVGGNGARLSVGDMRFLDKELP